MLRGNSQIGERGAVPIIFIGLVMIGLFLTLNVALVLGLNRAYKDRFDQSLFDKASKIEKLKDKLEVKKQDLSKLKQAAEAHLDGRTPAPDGEKPSIKERLKDAAQQMGR
jgi:hypothetical protein